MTIPTFQRKILGWHEKNGRHDLPWRHASLDPYAILVSEVMLQQTQVDRVIPKFISFLEKFPTPAKLSKAPTRALLSEWKGLGYNRRALYLQRAAKMLMKEYKGVFPTDPTEIEKLPGVGHYTARAVAAFAFDAPHVFIETNIRRIFLHFFFSGHAGISDDELLPLIEKALWKKSPRVWYSALMDYGALAMKEVQNPNKRSKHYTRQSRFEGSTRYARAKLLDFVMAQSMGASDSALSRFLKKDLLLFPYHERCEREKIVSSLVRDGFLEKKNARWTICEKNNT